MWNWGALNHILLLEGHLKELSTVSGCRIWSPETTLVACLTLYQSYDYCEWEDLQTCGCPCSHSKHPTVEHPSKPSTMELQLRLFAILDDEAVCYLKGRPHLTHRAYVRTTLLPWKMPVGRSLHDTLKQHLRALKTEPVTSIIEKISQEKVEKSPFTEMYWSASISEPKFQSSAGSVSSAQFGKVISFPAANYEYGARHLHLRTTSMFQV